MNLNQTFCASYCQNFKCKKMPSYSTLCAADARGIKLEFEDLSDDCDDYIPKYHDKEKIEVEL